MAAECVEVGECNHSISEASFRVPSGLKAHASGSDIMSYTKKAKCDQFNGLLINIFKVWPTLNQFLDQI
jgi:hypothetical protein